MIIHKPIGEDKFEVEETTVVELDRPATDCVLITWLFTVSETPISLHSVLSSDSSYSEFHVSHKFVVLDVHVIQLATCQDNTVKLICFWYVSDVSTIFESIENVKVVSTETSGVVNVNLLFDESRVTQSGTVLPLYDANAYCNVWVPVETMQLSSISIS